MQKFWWYPELQAIYSSVPNRRSSLISIQQGKKSPKINKSTLDFRHKQLKKNKNTESPIRESRVCAANSLNAIILSIIIIIVN